MGTFPGRAICGGIGNRLFMYMLATVSNCAHARQPWQGHDM